MAVHPLPIPPIELHVGWNSLCNTDLSLQEEFYGRELIIADREMCESGTTDMLSGAADRDVALLVVGDPLGATTHTDMLLRAKEMNIPFQVCPDFYIN